MSEYFLGLDIGTESVGWAVTDTSYQVQKKNGKALWGVRLFDEAEPAADRRGFRTARRRYERRKQRIDWLRQAFSKEIAKVDPAFFLRVDESKYLENDKKYAENGQPLGRYTLFADKDFCDKDYHKIYPTIYHLRQALLKKEREFDVRLVYLAIHHILKNRGHFLFGDMSLDDVSFEGCLNELKVYLEHVHDLSFELEDRDGFKQILTDRKLNTTSKKKALQKAAAFGKEDTQLLAIVDLLAGATVKPSALFAMEFSAEEDKGFSFKGDFDGKEAELADLLGEDMQLVQLIKRIYDWSILDELRAGETYLSDAKVKVYLQHKEELKQLKCLMKADMKAFKEMFRAARKNLDNYPAYCGHGSANYRCDYDKFSAYARKQLKAIMPKLNAVQKKQAEDIISHLEVGTFLGRQTSKNNGVIPHQLHEQELGIILERASAYLPFLNEVDESGLALKARIMEMFRFRIPYYVGPLDTRSEKSWLSRSFDKIYPWNFEQVIDLEKSAEEFITRMTATCSYIGEHVLPKDSLLYSRFVALNMINKIRVNDQLISVATKQRIFNDCLLKKGKGTYKIIRDYMLANGLLQKGDELGGIDQEFKVSLAGYKVFERILAKGDAFMMVEDIIKHIVLFGEDRKLLERWLRREYGKVLSDDDCKYVMRNNKSFSGWGNLSAEFLTEIKHADSQTGELISIIDMLWQTQDNLMELLSDRYTFAQAIGAYRDEKNGGKERTLDQVLQDSYAAPAIKRSIHQAIGIISEIEKIMRGKPKRVFIEVTRSDEQEKKRTVSRRRQLDELYADCKKNEREVWDQLQGCDDAALRSQKLYLYFLQMGKCMYSGEPIDLSRLGIDYDIDHIHPQCRVKDDGINNKVLVKKELNYHKGDQYPIPESYRKNPKVRELWTTLKAKKFITDEKYRRLTRNTAFEDNELSGFIARQLVETSQACKIVAELLRNRYGDDRVVYVKAGNVASFRQDQRILPDGTQKQAWDCKDIKEHKQDPLFVKCREVNDFHHAKDAYLNIVVGNVYHMKFTRNPLSFVRGGQTYSLNRMFDWDVVRNGECAWKKGDDGSIAVVRRMMRKNNILFTRHSKERTGGFYDQQPVSKAECCGIAEKAMLKSSDPRMIQSIYGGYNGLSVAYFMLVEHTNKKKRIRSIEPMYLRDKVNYKDVPEKYCQEVLKLEDAKILVPHILLGTLFVIDGFKMHLSSKDDDSRNAFRNANQLILSPYENHYVKRICKYIGRCTLAKKQVEINSFDELTKDENLKIYITLTSKMQNKTYLPQFASDGRKLENKAECFAALSVEEECHVLYQMILILNTKMKPANLDSIGESKQAGRIRVGKKLNMRSSYKIIHQSITGFFEQEIDLLGDFA